MPWPLSQDYNEAVQSPQTSFSDPELRGGEAVVNALGMPMPCSGNFADVYQFKCPATRRSWAVKCFTRQIPGLQERYQQVSLYLGQVKLPFMVDFTFLDRGIRVRGEWYPVLKMQWVEGFSLNTFVKDNLDKPQVLKMLCQIWVKLARCLREADMAHCDLQHGNVLLVRGGKAGTLGVRLVDYDGMCVPALTLLKSIELGHPSFQHPQRLREGTYSLEVDRFSHLVIYTALRSLIVAGRPLWEKYDNGDNLLFRAQDFEAPSKSRLFYELLKLNDPSVKVLVEQLIASARKPLDQVPLLTDLAPSDQAATVPPRTRDVAQALQPFAWWQQHLKAAAASGDARGEQSAVRLASTCGRSTNATWLKLVAGAAILIILGFVFTGLIFLLFERRASQTPPLAFDDQSRSAPPPNSGPSSPSNSMRTDRGGQTAVVRVEPPGPKPVIQVPPPVVPPDAGGAGRFVGHNSPIWSLAFSADGRRLVSGGRDQTVRLWDVETGKELNRFVGHTATIGSVALSPDGRRVLSGSADQTARLWDVESGKQIHRLDQTSPVWSVAFSPDGRLAISTGGIRKIVDGKYVSSDGSVRLWDVETGQEIRRFEGPQSLITQAVFTPDDRRILFSSTDATVRLWDVETGRQIRQYPAIDGVNGVAVSADGRYALSASYPKNMQLWDVETGQQLRMFSDFPAAVWKVAFSPDGHFGMCTSEKTLFVYDMRSGAAVYQCRLAPDSTARVVAFSPDGRSVVCGSLNTVQFFPLPDPLTGPGSGSAGPTVGGHPVPVPQPPTRETEITNSIGMKLVLIPAGKFLMGSPENEEGRYGGEGPQHEVKISKPFYLGQYPVTMGQFRAFVRDKNYPWQDRGGSTQSENQPAAYVSWNDAVAFCDWLSKKEGKHYRLPTEAEWEYSCRAGTATAYSFGDDLDKLWEYAWFKGNSGGETHEVGTKKPNPWGLYDMHGNVRQWCDDRYKEYYLGKQINQRL